MIDITQVKQITAGRLSGEEGERHFIYLDSVNKRSIGIGRNLDDVGISHNESLYLLSNDLDRTIADLDKFQPWWRDLDPVRASVLLDMAFNMGDESDSKGLRTFINTLDAFKSHNWQAVHDGMLNSKWAAQVKDRATVLANAILTGHF